MTSEVDDFLDHHFMDLNPFFPVDDDSAIADRSLAKLRTLAARRGVTPRALVEELALATPKERAAIMRAVNRTRVDPRSGGGLS